MLLVSDLLKIIFSFYSVVVQHILEIAFFLVQKLMSCLMGRGGGLFSTSNFTFTSNANIVVCVKDKEDECSVLTSPSFFLNLRKRCFDLQQNFTWKSQIYVSNNLQILWAYNLHSFICIRAKYTKQIRHRNCWRLSNLHVISFLIIRGSIFWNLVNYDGIMMLKWEAKGVLLF